MVEVTAETIRGLYGREIGDIAFPKIKLGSNGDELKSHIRLRSDEVVKVYQVAASSNNENGSAFVGLTKAGTELVATNGIATGSPLKISNSPLRFGLSNDGLINQSTEVEGSMEFTIEDKSVTGPTVGTPFKQDGLIDPEIDGRAAGAKRSVYGPYLIPANTDATASLPVPSGHEARVHRAQLFVQDETNGILGNGNISVSVGGTTVCDDSSTSAADERSDDGGNNLPLTLSGGAAYSVLVNNGTTSERLVDANLGVSIVST